MKILLLDNFDSFTYNLFHYLDGEGTEVTVRRNDASDLFEGTFDGAVLSPGPGLPNESGQLMDFIRQRYDHLPILGVCLGFQALIEYAGGSLFNLPEVYHGRPSTCKIVLEDQLLKDVSNPFQVGRYHSWAVQPSTLPEAWKVTSMTRDIVMSASHVSLPLYGVQFHPESVLTPEGRKMIRNWLESVRNFSMRVQQDVVQQ